MKQRLSLSLMGLLLALLLIAPAQVLPVAAVTPPEPPAAEEAAPITTPYEFPVRGGTDDG